MKSWTPVLIAIVIAVALAYYMAQANNASDGTGETGNTGDNTDANSPGQMNISSAGLALIQQFEGSKKDASGNYVAYPDATGTWTIGFGHTAGVQPGQLISESQAQAFLQADVQHAISAVQSHVTVPLSQNQFDALTSFAFNVGTGNFIGSTLLAMVNRGNISGSIAQFGAWVHSKGQVLAGLITRRAAEAALFGGF